MPDTSKGHSKKSDELTVQEAGHMGGQRERELVEEGHQREQQQGHKHGEFGEKVEHRKEDREEAA